MGFLSSLFKKHTKIILLTFSILLILTGATAIYSLFIPSTTTNHFDKNSSFIETNYNYQAKIIPNVLYPAGGTVDVGKSIFKKITTAIPVTIQSTINSEQEVSVTGTHDVQLILKAGEQWEREFPFGQKHDFTESGAEISIINQNYEINLNTINSFIQRVEEETGIRSSQYTLEVIPNIEGAIQYDGMQKAFHIEDKLVFQFEYDEIVLASEQDFAATIPFVSTEIITNTFNLFELELPLVPTRVISTTAALLLLVSLAFAYRASFALRGIKSPSQIDRINKKYGSRIISVSQKINGSQKSFINLTSFSSLLKISDEKELPIFHHKWHHGSAEYFIVDGEYVYTFEIVQSEVVRGSKESSGSEKAYANG